MLRIKNGTAHVSAVIKGMLFTGFSVQIILGLAWMGCNIGQVQDFAEPDSVLYRAICRFFGGSPVFLYFAQLAGAFFAGLFLLRRFRSIREPASPGERLFALWQGLALLTLPFAMQCHLALLPHSFMGSLYLLMLGCLLEVFPGREEGGSRKKRVAFLTLAVLCLTLTAVLSGVLDEERQERPGYSFQGAMASRFGWAYIWQDREQWTEDLREMVGDVLWETSFCPGNMELLQAALEDRVGRKAAGEYYLQIARVGWERHASLVIRQIGWDVLGYTVTPVVFPLQMRGHAYDSYSGRNYEVMREHAPVLTRYYVYYGCWWFGCSLILALASAVLSFFDNRKRKGGLMRWCVCVLVSGVLAVLLTMRGAGVMDYKCTIAVNELWLIWALGRISGGCREGTGKRGSSTLDFGVSAVGRACGDRRSVYGDGCDK